VLAPAARLVRHHHDRWSGSGGPWPAGPATPLESRILHLADRVDVLLEHDGSPLPQRRSIAAAVRELSGVDFDPQVCEAFLELSAREYLWLEMTSPELDHVLDDLTAGLPEVPLQGRATVEVAWVFSRFIDSHSRFTHRHSSGVAAVAVSLAARAGLSPRRQGQLAVAALLHDLGKVSVPGPSWRSRDRSTRTSTS
jgi:response regulator RpfG family c-di-GMP phosphodiesterase